MTGYQRFQELNINFSAIGMEQDNTSGTYFCTPKGASVIGWAGEDGIHSCFVQGFGDTVFTVNPESPSRKYVHPVARNFEDFLRLLLACKDMKTVEELYHCDEEEGFECWMRRYESTQEQLETLETLQKEFSISPMEHPVTYVRQLQKDFDYSKIPYTQAYYDETSDEEEESEQWKVTYDGNFWGNSGQVGKEIPVGKVFHWGEETWQIPSVYLCGRGLVVDFCVEVEPEAIKAFIDKWDLLHEAEHDYTQRQQEQIREENPLRIEFQPELVVNGRLLKGSRGCGVTWIPQSCIADEDDCLTEKQALEHYGLDESRGWMIARNSFSWQTAPISDIQSLQIRLRHSPVVRQGIQFEIQGAGDQVSFTNPVTGTEHTLTVQAYKKQEIEKQYLPADGLEYPNHYTEMVYTIVPDLSEEDFQVEAWGEVDQPRIINQDNTNASACAFGIIGGADGPVAIFIENEKESTCHTVCSSLHFDPEAKVQWYMKFWEKRTDDISVTLI